MKENHLHLDFYHYSRRVFIVLRHLIIFTLHASFESSGFSCALAGGDASLQCPPCWMINNKNSKKENPKM